MRYLAILLFLPPIVWTLRRHRPRHSASDQSSTPPTFATKASDLEALRGALVDASAISSTIWVSYMTILFYFLVAAAAVTHKDLLLDSPVKLPFLNIDMPLTSFFRAGPIIFVLFHLYVMLHFAMLTSRARAFDRQLRTQVLDEEVRNQLRDQLPASIFVQFLVGPSGSPRRIIRLLLHSSAWATLVAGPVILLSFFIIQFLPYHNFATTWLQRIVLVLDVCLVMSIWRSPKVARWDEGQRWPSAAVFFAYFSRLSAILQIVTLGLVIFFIAILPGENPLADAISTLSGGLVQRGGWTGTRLAEINERLLPLRKSLIEGEIDPISNRPSSLFANRLVLVGGDAIDRVKFDSDEKISASLFTTSLRGRDLTGAILPRTRLRKVDLTSANLANADLQDADLRGAILDGATLRQAKLDRAHLEAATLDNADLRGATLSSTQLKGVTLDESQLQGANLTGANLTGATLNFAQLQGARLISAVLDGASLQGAQMQGTLLFGLSMKGAFLKEAQLQGAILANARLQGVVLQDTNLEAADLYCTNLWRAENLGPNLNMAWARNTNTDANDNVAECGGARWSHEDYEKLKDNLRGITTHNPMSLRTLSSIDVLDPSNPGIKSSLSDQLEKKRSKTTQEYVSYLVQILGEVGCNSLSPSFVLMGMTNTFIKDGFFRNIYDHPPDKTKDLARMFLDPGCKGSHELRLEDREILERTSKVDADK